MGSITHLRMLVDGVGSEKAERNFKVEQINDTTAKRVAYIRENLQRLQEDLKRTVDSESKDHLPKTEDETALKGIERMSLLGQGLAKDSSFSHLLALKKGNELASQQIEGAVLDGVFQEAFLENVLKKIRVKNQNEAN